MLSFLARRLLVAIPLLVAASLIVFAMVVNLGAPQKLENALARPDVQPAAVEAIRRQFEMDKPVVERYVDWAGGLVQGDLGQDGDQVPVREELWRSMKVTLRLLLFSLVASVAIGVLIGVISASRQYTAFDYATTGLAFFFFSIPTAVLAGFLKFFGIIGFNSWARHPTMSTPVLLGLLVAGGVCGLAYIRGRRRHGQMATTRRLATGAAAGIGVALGLVLVFKWGWDGNVYRQNNPRGMIPTIGQQSTRPPADLWGRLQDYFWHLLGPSLTLILVGLASYSRYTRASVLDQLSADYVRTARAKGASERRVLTRHVLRNALIPVTTIVALDFGLLLSGAIITERIFAWKGMGTFFIDALTQKEPYPLMAFAMVTASMVIVFNLIADLLYAVLDPRIRRA